ncbi:AbrB family transcriptional regulator [Rhizobium sp. CC-YZS058]|uniref:AbrB family transcriptional regulator n=1 Tax=Rhizobium sp. CC-YZS058 TaxID=3042153 RepID=UPI002B05781A|nr:AbrB family transcriptional regulator [Rhizobium sp. CC-YZS058]MEA3535871.1 AbrB family transcriptional regulator [Rhizobium sp. CC-YZS058]
MVTILKPVGWRSTRRLVETLACGAAGGALLESGGFPAGWLCGSMAAVMIAVLCRRDLKVPERLRGVAFVFLGASMGSSLTPDTFAKIQTWPVSITLLMLSVIATMVVGTQYLMRRHCWDIVSARLSSVPGALSAVLAIAADSRGDLGKITVSQGLRQVVLVCMVPVMLYFSPELAPVTKAAVASLLDLVLMTGAGIAGAALCTLVRIPGALLVGALLGSGLVHAMGLVSGTMPPIVLIIAYVVAGSSIGTRLRGMSLSALKAICIPAIGSIFAAIIIAALFAALTASLTGLPFVEVWLAFAPGGVESMTILAFVLNLDPSFVSSHHIIRLIALMLLSPLWTMGLQKPSA